SGGRVDGTGVDPEGGRGLVADRRPGHAGRSPRGRDEHLAGAEPRRGRLQPDARPPQQRQRHESAGARAQGRGDRRPASAPKTAEAAVTRARTSLLAGLVTLSAALALAQEAPPPFPSPSPSPTPSPAEAKEEERTLGLPHG